MSARKTQMKRAAPRSSTRLHPITFCESCHEPIPARAMTCLHCGAKQSHAEGAMQVTFCEKCGRDYPARAMHCFHCGAANTKHPLFKGTVTR